VNRFLLLPVRDDPPGLFGARMLWGKKSGVEPASILGYHADCFTLRGIWRSDSAVGAFEALAQLSGDFSFWAGRQGCGGLLTE
jgi:hypothetical protein